MSITCHSEDDIAAPLTVEAADNGMQRVAFVGGVATHETRPSRTGEISGRREPARQMEHRRCQLTYRFVSQAILNVDHFLRAGRGP